MQWYLLPHCTALRPAGQVERLIGLSSILVRAPIIGNQDAIHGKRKSHHPAAAAINGIANHLAFALGVDCRLAGLSVVIGDIGSRRHRKHIGRNHDCAETQHAEDDKYDIHEGYSPKASGIEICILYAISAPIWLVLIIQVLAACYRCVQIATTLNCIKF